MEKIEEILLIENTNQRQTALRRYARQLQVRIERASLPDGTLDEDALTVLIYNANASKKRSRLSNVGFLVVGAILSAAVCIAIFLLINLEGF